MKAFKLQDIRNTKAFPDLEYRFGKVKETEDAVIIDRDFLGENPVHYYIDGKKGELLIASNIADIKSLLEKQRRIFVWDRVRGVSNNSRLIIDNLSFSSTSPQETEIGETLQQMNLDNSINYNDLSSVATRVRELLESSTSSRLKSVNDEQIGLLLSGGLDSMSVGYFLSKARNYGLTAFTLKVSDNDKDIVKSRELAQRYRIDLIEIGLSRDQDSVKIVTQKYNPAREIKDKKELGSISLEESVSEALRISGNPKRDNAFCAIAMYLAGKAIQSEGISIVFCGEGPNEMINDYGYNPELLGYGTPNKGDFAFREALTFGMKMNDKQLGRGGLPKHAIARMGKIFAHYDIRLEAPYFNKQIAKIMTHIPHSTSYDTVKQHLMKEVLFDAGLDDLIEGTSKEKFQDGSGVSGLFESFDQRKLITMFDQIYGIRKNAYLIGKD
ncbi:MAG: asparagine synthase-related protein [Nanoarchaeota archaeon]